MSKMHFYSCFTDGSSKGNRGLSGWGWVAYNDHNKFSIQDEHSTGWGGKETGTNQEMELRAFLELLIFFDELYDDFESSGHKNCMKISIYSDSSYVVNGITPIVKKEGELLSKLTVVKKDFKGYLFSWVNEEYKEGYSLQDGCNVNVWKGNRERVNGEEWWSIYRTLRRMIDRGIVIELGWCKGHASIKGNVRADFLANNYAKERKAVKC